MFALFSFFNINAVLKFWITWNIALKSDYIGKYNSNNIQNINLWKFNVLIIVVVS